MPEGCTRCGLHKFRGDHYVSGDGPAACSLMFIGEAPGEREAAMGKPFVGQVGQVLNACLKAAGIQRDGVFVSNTVRCRPPKNRKPTKDEMAACADHLWTEIDLVRPRVILAMGDTAMKWFKISNSVTRNRGKIFRKDGFIVVPTFHPALALRNPANTSAIIQDIKQALAVLQGSGQDRNKYYVAKTVDGVRRVVEKILSAKAVVVDVETTGLNPFKEAIIGVAFSWLPHTGVYVPISAGDWKRTPDATVEVVALLRSVLESDVPKVMHGGSFDCLFLRAQWGIQVKNFCFDTMLAHHLLDEDSPHDLKSLARVYVDLAEYEADLEEAKDRLRISANEGYGRIPLDTIFRYAAADADATLRLYQDFSVRLEKERLVGLFTKLTMPLQHEVMSAEFHGVRIDERLLQDLTKEYEEHLAELEVKVRRYLGDINLKSSRQLVKALYTDLGLPVMKLTEKAQTPSTDKNALGLLRGKHKVIDSLLDWRSLQTVLSTFMRPGSGVARTVDGRIHTRYNLHGTVMGRLSSSMPNLQNIPRDNKLRSVFVADEGHKLVIADFNQMEYRILADYSKDDNLMGMYQRGGDIHAETCLRVLGKEHPTAADRTIAKKVNFGTIYGLGAEALSMMLLIECGIKLSVRRCRELQEAQFDAYPGVRNLKSRVMATIHQHLKLVNKFGRVRRLPYANSSNPEMVSYAERQGFHSLISGTASDITSLATIRIGHRVREGLEAFLGLTVHDELVYSCAEQDVEQLCGIIKHEAEEKGFPGVVVPLRIDIQVSDRWGKIEKGVRNGNEHADKVATGSAVG